MADTYLSFTGKDLAGRKKPTHVHLPGATSANDIAAFAAAHVALLDAASGLQWIKMQYTVELVIPGGLSHAAGADAGIDARNGAQLSFENSSRYKYGVWIPGAPDADFAGEQLITGAANEWDDLIASFVTGSAGITPVNGFSLDVGTFDRGLKAYRK